MSETPRTPDDQVDDDRHIDPIDLQKRRLAARLYASSELTPEEIQKARAQLEDITTESTVATDLDLPPTETLDDPKLAFRLMPNHGMILNEQQQETLKARLINASTPVEEVERISEIAQHAKPPADHL